VTDQTKGMAAAAVGPALLPELQWVPTNAMSPRYGAHVTHVIVHRWGVRFTSLADEVRTAHGVVNYFKDRKNGASAHVVFPGGATPRHAYQMVPWGMKAWAEADYNATSDDFESDDAIWNGHDPVGMHILARMVACRLHVRGLPPIWSRERGFARHADLGAAGGGHTQCPTTDLNVWKAFVHLVQFEHHRGGFRPVWGR
jgi:hypothetical protein